MWRDGQYRQVPACRADVFKDSTLGLLDKNALKSFLDKLEQHAKATQDEHKVRYPQAIPRKTT